MPKPSAFWFLVVITLCLSDTAKANASRQRSLIACVTTVLRAFDVTKNRRQNYHYPGREAEGLNAFDLVVEYVPGSHSANPLTRMSYFSETGQPLHQALLGRTSTDLSDFHALLRNDRDAIERLVNLVELRTARRIVDVASGQGKFVESLRSFGVRGAEGVDLILDPRQRLRSHFKRGSAWNLPYRSRSIDILYETWGPTWFRECKMKNKNLWSTIDVLKEYHRVLRPGGVVRLGPLPLENLNTSLEQVPGLTLRFAARTSYGTRVYVELQKE